MKSARYGQLLRRCVKAAVSVDICKGGSDNLAPSCVPIKLPAPDRAPLSGAAAAWRRLQAVARPCRG